MSEKLKLADAISQLNAAIVQTVQFFDDIDKNNFREVLKAYKLLKDNTENLEEITKILSAFRKLQSEKVIPEIFENLGIDSITIGNFSYGVSVRSYASIPEELKAKGYAWLKENGYEPLVKEYVHPQALTGAICGEAGYIKEKGLLPPEDAIKIHQTKYTSVRKK